MITHKIVLSRPWSEQPKVVHEPQPAPGWLTQPVSHKAENQQELNKVLTEVNASVGDFYCYDGQHVHSLACIHVVLEIETDFTKVSKSISGKVMPFHLLQVERWSPTAYQWKRWDDLIHFRPITEKEYKSYVEPNFDNVQDYCKSQFPEGFILQPGFRQRRI